MATVVQSGSLPANSGRTRPRGSDDRFFLWFAALLACLTGLGFSTTYLLPVASGRFSGEPILHVHGILFLAWPLLLLIQTCTASRSRRWHRTMGFIGISLATAMILTGLLAIGSSINSWGARGIVLEAQAISIVAFSGVILFAILFSIAIASIGDRATHARLMMVATLTIMQGVWGRFALMALYQGNPDMLRPGLLMPPPPMVVMVTHLAFDILFLGIMAFHDRRSTGQIHRATLFGGGGLILVHSIRHLFLNTAAWAAIARWLASL